MCFSVFVVISTLSWRRSLYDWDLLVSIRRDILVPTGFYKFWFLYDRDLRHERANIDLYNINSVKTKLLVLLWNKRAKMTWSTICGYCAEAVVWMCSVEKVFLEILQNSQENTCARVSFLIKLQALKKRNF